jgi:hypothetical protein
MNVAFGCGCSYQCGTICSIRQYILQSEVDWVPAFMTCLVSRHSVLYASSCDFLVLFPNIPPLPYLSKDSLTLSLCFNFVLHSAHQTWTYTVLSLLGIYLQTTLLTTNEAFVLFSIAFKSMPINTISHDQQLRCFIQFQWQKKKNPSIWDHSEHEMYQKKFIKNLLLVTDTV